jgi:hypothetical protein
MTQYEVRPKPVFQLEQVIKAPRRIVDSGKVRIVGIEWGPDSRTHRCPKWLYHCTEHSGKIITGKETQLDFHEVKGSWFYVSEEELVKWQKE